MIIHSILIGIKRTKISQKSIKLKYPSYKMKSEKIKKSHHQKSDKVKQNNHI